MASLKPELAQLNNLADALLADLAATRTLELRYQRLIAETALLRLFYTFDNIIESVALKLICSNTYCDGSAPVRLQPIARSLAIAANSVAVARPRVRHIKWTTLQDINANLATFFSPHEHLLFQRGVIDPVFEDMRHVRNHIAHGSRSTQAKFATVVAKIYPGNPRGISPGKLLLSQKRAFVGAPGGAKQRVIEQYLLWSKVAMKTLVKG